jgi:hypothetical protein
MNKEYFNCGISAPVTNLDYHYLILNLIDEKFGLEGKNILIEHSIQGALSDTIVNSKSFTSYLDVAPLRTKIFWIRVLFVENEWGNINIKNLSSLVLSILIPSAGLRNLSLKPEFLERKNHYLDRVFDPSNIPAVHKAMFQKEFDRNLSTFRAKEIVAFAREKGAIVSFLIPPSNSFYIEKISDDVSHQLNVFFDSDIMKKRSVDLRSFDSMDFFADCCHFNKKGQEVIEASDLRFELNE